MTDSLNRHQEGGENIHSPSSLSFNEKQEISTFKLWEYKNKWWRTKPEHIIKKLLNDFTQGQTLDKSKDTKEEKRTDSIYISSITLKSTIRLVEEIKTYTWKDFSNQDKIEINTCGDSKYLSIEMWWNKIIIKYEESLWKMVFFPYERGSLNKEQILTSRLSEQCKIIRDFTNKKLEELKEKTLEIAESKEKELSESISFWVSVFWSISGWVFTITKVWEKNIWNLILEWWEKKDFELSERQVEKIKNLIEKWSTKLIKISNLAWIIWKTIDFWWTTMDFILNKVFQKTDFNDFVERLSFEEFKLIDPNTMISEEEFKNQKKELLKSFLSEVEVRDWYVAYLNRIKKLENKFPSPQEAENVRLDFKKFKNTMNARAVLWASWVWRSLWVIAFLPLVARDYNRHPDDWIFIITWTIGFYEFLLWMWTAKTLMKTPWKIAKTDLYKNLSNQIKNWIEDKKRLFWNLKEFFIWNWENPSKAKKYLHLFGEKLKQIKLKFDIWRESIKRSKAPVFLKWVFKKWWEIVAPLAWWLVWVMWLESIFKDSVDSWWWKNIREVRWNFLEEWKTKEADYILWMWNRLADGLWTNIWIQWTFLELWATELNLNYETIYTYLNSAERDVDFYNSKATKLKEIIRTKSLDIVSFFLKESQKSWRLESIDLNSKEAKREKRKPLEVSDMMDKASLKEEVKKHRMRVIEKAKTLWEIKEEDIEIIMKGIEDVLENPFNVVEISSLSRTQSVWKLDMRVPNWSFVYNEIKINILLQIRKLLERGTATKKEISFIIWSELEKLLIERKEKTKVTTTNWEKREEKTTEIKTLDREIKLNNGKIKQVLIAIWMNALSKLKKWNFPWLEFIARDSNNWENKIRISYPEYEIKQDRDKKKGKKYYTSSFNYSWNKNAEFNWESLKSKVWWVNDKWKYIVKEEKQETITWGEFEDIITDIAYQISIYWMDMTEEKIKNLSFYNKLNKDYWKYDVVINFLLDNVELTLVLLELSLRLQEAKKTKKYLTNQDTMKWKSIFD